MDATFFETPADFRQWLQAHHTTEKELWVGYYKKATGLPSMTWSESVDQALCFGWIDGIRKSIDDIRYRIRFTPRNPKSIWSAVNIQKMEELQAAGLMTPAGLALFSEEAIQRSQAYFSERDNAQLPAEYLAQLQANQQAWSYFSQMAPSYQKVAIHWVISAKREETKLRRFGILIESSAERRKIPPFRRKGE